MSCPVAELAWSFLFGGVVFLVLFCVGFTAGVWAEQRRVKWEATNVAPPG